MLEKHFAASAIVYYQNKVLLIYHKKLDVWNFPGGHIERHEAPDEAVCREVWEECGIEIDLLDISTKKYCDVRTIPMPVSIWEEKIYKHNAVSHYHIDFVYLATIRQVQDVDFKKQSFNSPEDSPIGWFTLEDLSRLNMLKNVREIISDYWDNGK